MLSDDRSLVSVPPCCAVCGTRLVSAARGRPPKYCGNACRQRAFRNRSRVREGRPPLAELPDPPGEFVGRLTDLNRLRSLQRTARFLTLAGPPGAGKTRLALRLASGSRGGARFVPLASAGPDDLLPHLLAALGIRERPGETLGETLVKALRGQRMWLVLDGCEHVAAPCARLATTLLRHCPALRVLATSRVPLRVPGEVIHPVGALPVPEAAQLLALRSGRPTPSREDHDRSRRLDGLPLTIELAAGHHVGRATLRDVLDLRYRDLSEPERHVFRRISVWPSGFDVEAAEAVCEQPDVAGVLARLADKSLVTPGVVFGQPPAEAVGEPPDVPAVPAGMSLVTPGALSGQASAEAVSEQPGVPAVLARPMNKSLATPGVVSGQTLAEAMYEQSDVPGHLVGKSLVTPGVVSGHMPVDAVCEQPDALGMLTRPVGKSAGIPGAVSGQSPADAVREQPDVTALPARPVDKSPVTAGVLFGQTPAIREFARGRLAVADEPARARAVAWLTGLVRAGFPAPEEIARHRGNFAVLLRATAPGDEHLLLATGLALAWSHAGQRTVARALLSRALDVVPRSPHRAFALAHAARLSTDPATAAEAIAAARDDVQLAVALDAQAFIALSRNDFRGAVAAYRECITHHPTPQADFARALLYAGDVTEAARILGACIPALRDSPSRLTAALHTAGALHLTRGEYAAAEATFAELLHLATSGDEALANAVEGLAILAVHEHPRHALRLIGAAASIRRRTGIEAHLPWQQRVNEATIAAENVLTPSDAAAALAAGRRLPTDRLAAVAAPREQTLSPREIEVARLVADGRTNHQIAAELSVPAGVVAAHLDRIRAKAGLRSRAQVALWFTARP